MSWSCGFPCPAHPEFTIWDLRMTIERRSTAEAQRHRDFNTECWKSGIITTKAQREQRSLGFCVLSWRRRLGSGRFGRRAVCYPVTRLKIFFVVQPRGWELVRRPLPEHPGKPLESTGLLVSTNRHSLASFFLQRNNDHWPMLSWKFAHIMYVNPHNSSAKRRLLLQVRCLDQRKLFAIAADQEQR